MPTPSPSPAGEGWGEEIQNKEKLYKLPSSQPSPSREKELVANLMAVAHSVGSIKTLQNIGQ
jgi:hypothetical protein